MKKLLFLAHVFLLFTLNAFAAETYKASTEYPGGSVVEFKGKTYRAKWWASAGQSPAAVATVANSWDSPWEVFDDGKKVEQKESPRPALSPIDTSSDAGAASPPTASGVDLTNADKKALPQHLFAPFVDAALYPTPRIADIAKATGVKHYILGFLVSDPQNPGTASWGGYYNLEQGPNSWDSQGNYFLYDEIKKLRADGGDVIVSLGGASGTPLAVAEKSVEQLANEYKRIVKQFDLQMLDFDIEGGAIADKDSIERRSKAIALLQKEYPNLKVWYTLPVLPTGLTRDGIGVIESALKAGVILSGVNVMAMDYGDTAAPSPEGKMGKYATDTIKALHGQLEDVYQRHEKALTDQELWKMIGVTPMIGLNDVTTERFHLSDAQELLEFAKQKEIGLIGIWSANRDHSCPDKGQVGLKCSSIKDQTESYQFMNTFKSFTQE